MSTLTVSYAEANRELVKSFVRYLESRGMSPSTIRKYRESCERFVGGLGSASVASASRSDVRIFLGELGKRGLKSRSISLHIKALRAFYRFLNLSELTRHNPALLITQRKEEHRLGRVAALTEIESWIAVARDPFERAVVEVLYATGCRVSELVQLRLENIRWHSHMIRIEKGKGRKDRRVPFGRPAAEAMLAYQKWRPSVAGYLFESPARVGSVYLRKGYWQASFYANGVQRNISLGPFSKFATEKDAEEAFRRRVENMPGYHPVPARPYSTAAIRGVLKRLSHRAGTDHVNPHALRRSIATHLLQDGVDIRYVQEILGHDRVSTTQRYTTLMAHDLKRVHERFHPHEQRRAKNGEA